MRNQSLSQFYPDSPVLALAEHSRPPCPATLLYNMGCVL